MRIPLNHPDRGKIIAEYKGEPERPHKYGAKPVVIDGHRFPSRKEARRYGELKLLERGGKIKDLRLQVSYDLEVNGMHICRFIADFVYWHVGNNREYVEDAKGFKTDVYRLKRKLMRACLGIEILET